MLFQASGLKWKLGVWGSTFDRTHELFPAKLKTNDHIVAWMNYSDRKEFSEDGPIMFQQLRNQVCCHIANSWGLRIGLVAMTQHQEVHVYTTADSSLQELSQSW